MKYSALIIFLIVLLGSNIMAQDRAETGFSQQTKLAAKSATFKTDKGWGYDVYINGEKYIHQEVIPSVPGVKGFKTEEDAKKTAALIVSKIHKGLIPPSVTPAELDSMGVWSREQK